MGRLGLRRSSRSGHCVVLPKFSKSLGSLLLLLLLASSSQCLAFAVFSAAPNKPHCGKFISQLELFAANKNLRNDGQQRKEMLDLQAQHPAQTPSQVLRSLAQFCDDNGVNGFDVYGDFAAAPDESYLRKFESEVAAALGMDDAVFMPSGVMAQSIALLIHSRSGGTASRTELLSGNDSSRWAFAAHRTSHLLLHENEGYSDLLDMEAVVLPLGARPCGGHVGGSLGVEPMRLSDLQEAISRAKTLDGGGGVVMSDLSTVILEVPHRELGGKLTPWDEVVEMGELCRRHGVAFHCDGARIFEAAAGYGLELPNVTKPFDSVYISFYKGLGGISGAMLLGEQSFCSEARIWLRRFGGNLFTLLPYAISAWSSYKTRGMGEGSRPTFEEKRNKLRRFVSVLSEDEDIGSIIAFDPKVPETNMVHGFIRSSLEDFQDAVDEIAKRQGVKVLSRVRAIADAEDESSLDFGCRFEWTMGDANANVDDEIFFRAWKAFAISLIGRQAGD